MAVVPRILPIHAVGGRGLSHIWKSAILFNLGCISLEEGDVSDAKLRLRESLEIGAELTNDELVAYGLYGLAGVAVMAGEPERGALLAGAAEVIFESIGIVVQVTERNFVDRVTAEIRERLDGETLEREWARGRSMSSRRPCAWPSEIGAPCAGALLLGHIAAA